MPSVLFVCSANQFRSPLAAVLFEKKLQAEGKSEGWTISSAGTWVKEKNSAHPAAIQQAKKHDMDLSKHSTREVNGGSIEANDLVIVMTHNQKEALQFEFPAQRSKIVMLSELAGHGEVDVSDPVEKNFAESDDIFADLNHEIDLAYKVIITRATLQR
jgi:protein-tyrosine phosphatase